MTHGRVGPLFPFRPLVDVVGQVACGGMNLHVPSIRGRLQVRERERVTSRVADTP